MIRHLFTLMWNRKRANGLLLLEIVLAFVVLFAVGSVGVYNWRNYRTPLGFAYEHVWEVDMNPGIQPSWASRSFASGSSNPGPESASPPALPITTAGTPAAFAAASTGAASPTASR